MPASVLTEMRGKQHRDREPPAPAPLPHHLGPGNVGCVLEDDLDDEDEDFDGADEVKSSGGSLTPPAMDANGVPPPPTSGPNSGGAGFWLAAVTAATLGPAHGQHPMEHPMAPMNTAETGFINSQPSMAEFMTALPHPHMGGDLQGPGSLSPQPPGGYPPMDGHGGVNVPEYPWMKEKKTTRKSSQQGRPPGRYSAHH